MVKRFLKHHLSLKHPRDDYKELLELVSIFVGVTPRDEVKFRRPGACHRARWMMRDIYSLKTYMLRDELDLNNEDVEKLRQICLFSVFIYIPAWFAAPSALQAASNDLMFMKNLYAYRYFDDEVVDAVLEKFKNHLWYLSPEACALEFFDESLPNEVKQKIVLALTLDPGSESSNSKRI
ncbi:hypothetical protein QAD02_005026 [Eretmocerus hayati]|uniref:Uncharacterized protein n=1 Tax=Eretmocerus hayati TaxID=131215 RepID=A0ACC2NR83_9HYME|nr:hypothetical protein QAD02_005026 [Eretmocerus hayati]